jgi:hypothetical protein
VNLKIDVVVANEPIPSVSRKSVTKPTARKNGVGGVARACWLARWQPVARHPGSLSTDGHGPENDIGHRGDPSATSSNVLPIAGKLSPMEFHPNVSTVSKT